MLEYVEGETLSGLLERQGRLNAAQIEGLLTDVLSGLEAVHAAGFVHRDLKPGNLMVRPDGNVVVLDFGAARQAVGQRSKSAGERPTEAVALWVGRVVGRHGGVAILRVRHRFRPTHDRRLIRPHGQSPGGAQRRRVHFVVARPDEEGAADGCEGRVGRTVLVGGCDGHRGDIRAGGQGRAIPLSLREPDSSARTFFIPDRVDAKTGRT